MKLFLNMLGCFFFISFFCCTWAPRQGFGEKNMLSEWHFKLGDVRHGQSDTIDTSDWQAVRVPHDWSVNQMADSTLSSCTGYLPGGVARYRKSINLPDDDLKCYLYFEGKYRNSEVFINGKSLGVYPYGYTSFYYDLTEQLQYGQNNVLAVKVDNSIQKNSRWYSGSGIYRHVWLKVTNLVHVDQWGGAITTPSVSKEEATVKIETSLKNEKNTPQNVELKTEINGASFDVPYAPGVLKAVGVEEGNEMESKTLQTAGEATVINLSADRTYISASGQDLSFVTVQITDKDGVLKPNATNLLEFSIEGPGVIEGVDNANLKDLVSYVGNSRKAWNGRALAVIKSTRSSGEINLLVSSPGLSDASITLRSK